MQKWKKRATRNAKFSRNERRANKKARKQAFKDHRKGEGLFKAAA